MVTRQDVIAKSPLYPNPRPENCALIAIDLQNDFLKDEGWYSKEGEIDINHMKRTIEPVKKIIAFCRHMGIPIVACKHVFKDANIDGGIICKVRPLLQRGGLREGTWGGEIADEIELSLNKDWIFTKSRLSAFYNTPLELILRGLQKKTLILTGVCTNQCVESTIRDAQFRDFEVIELSDCVGTYGGYIHHPITRKRVLVEPQELQEASLRAVVFGFGDVVTSDELIQKLSK